MVSQCGAPDVMITFTYNNDWLEVKEIRKALAKEINLKISDINSRFCPYETMMLWKAKMKKISAHKYNDFAKAVGLGEVVHFL